MRAKTSGFMIAALFASVACAQAPAEQSVDRVLHFTHTRTVQDLQEIATLIRSMTDIRQVSANPEQKGIALRGAAGQIALAEWLVSELDKPADPRPTDFSIHEYRPAGSNDDVVRVFYLTHAEKTQDLQEIATLIRSIAEIRRLFTYNAPRALALRGTSDQMKLAEWLCNELNKPANRQTEGSAAHEYQLSASRDEVVRVYYLTHIKTAQELQEIATLVRSQAAIRWVLTYNAPRAMALRGTADQMALAERLIKQRRPAAMAGVKSAVQSRRRAG